MIDINSSPVENIIRIINSRIKPGYPLLKSYEVDIGNPLTINQYYRNTYIHVTGKGTSVTGSKGFYYLRVDPINNSPNLSRTVPLENGETLDDWRKKVYQMFSMIGSEFTDNAVIPAVNATRAVNFIAKDQSLLYVGKITVNLLNQNWPDINTIIPNPSRMITVLDPKTSLGNPRCWVPYADPAANMKIILEDYYPELKGKGYDYTYEIQSGVGTAGFLIVKGKTNITGTIKIPLTRLDVNRYKSNRAPNPVYVYVPFYGNDQDDYDRLLWSYGDWPHGVDYGFFGRTGAYPTRRNEVGYCGFHAAGSIKTNMFLAGQITWRVMGD